VEGAVEERDVVHLVLPSPPLGPVMWWCPGLWDVRRSEEVESRD
jgi:hypothetical protein